MVAAAKNLRHRKATNNNKKKKGAEKEAKKSKDLQLEPPKLPDEEEMSLWNVFRNHWIFPFCATSVVIGGPYLLYLVCLFVLLQRPEWMPLVPLRPAVGLSDARQVLIAGTMSSGTTQVAHELKDLGLEVGHEISESMWNFVRDGTVSWFHGIRFLTKPESKTHLQQALLTMCDEFTPHMGFHPRMFRDTSPCSPRETWSPCWSRECRQLLQQEWGCALLLTKNSCISPFVTTLHQVRHPLDTISSLVVKFCKGKSLRGILHPSFIKLSNGLFAHLNHNFSTYSCLQGASHYWLEYNNAMNAAKMAGLINRTYPIETTTPCQVLKWAGFLDPDKALYLPHVSRYQTKCQEHDDYNNDQKPPPPSQQLPMVSIKYSAKKSPHDLVLTWDDWEEEDSALLEQVQHWTQVLGYELDRTPSK